jgi:hypothetical protein
MIKIILIEEVLTITFDNPKVEQDINRVRVHRNRLTTSRNKLIRTHTDNNMPFLIHKCLIQTLRLTIIHQVIRVKEWIINNFLRKKVAQDFRIRVNRFLNNLPISFLSIDILIRKICRVFLKFKSLFMINMEVVFLKSQLTATMTIIFLVILLTILARHLRIIYILLLIAKFPPQDQYILVVLFKQILHP